MRTRDSRWSVVLVLALAGLLSSCDRRERIPHTSLESGLEPLAAAFNAHVGQVRVLMLVAPT